MRPSTIVLFLLVPCVAVVLAGACDSSTTANGVATVGATAGSGASGGGGSSSSMGGSAGMLNVGGCEANCEATYPAGVDPLAKLESCIYCEACFDLCEPEGYCPQGGSDKGCSDNFNVCTECAYSTCSWDYNGQDFTGVCSTAYKACDSSGSCMDLWTCLKRC